MCVTIGPAKLSKTVIYAGHAIRDEQRVAVLAYQNQAQSHGPNAMVLPIPTDIAMGPDNMVDTRSGGWFLKQLDEATEVRQKGFFRSLSFDALNSVQVFDSGSYTVVLATDPMLIPQALQQVPVEKRPYSITPQFLKGYSALYPGWPVAVCCWHGQLESEPIMWWYVPRDERLFIPTMDAHDGNAPKAGPVEVDHKLIWEADSELQTRSLLTSKLPPEIDNLLAPTIRYQKLTDILNNGDTWVEGGITTRIPL